MYLGMDMKKMAKEEKKEGVDRQVINTHEFLQFWIEDQVDIDGLRFVTAMLWSKRKNRKI